MFIAHIRSSDHEIQDVQTHLDEVAALARQYGDATGFGAHAELAGLLHDMGKYTQAFTNYITDAVYHQKVSTTKIDHSTAGAKYLYERHYKTHPYVAEIIGMAVLAHHSGLQNFIQLDLAPSDYIRRVVNKELPYYNEVKANFEAVSDNVARVDALFTEAIEEFKALQLRVKSLALPKPLLYFNYVQKLVLSFLLDADRTNTRCFEEQTLPSQKQPAFATYYHELMKTVNGWQQSTTLINQLRTEMSENCDRLAEQPSAIYTLSIPTGGGKTFASLRYALKHAAKYHKKRIIYVVPYTTILEQNASAVAAIIAAPEAVLEHHANIIAEDDDSEDYYDNKLRKKMQLGRDNWDYPIIFTTMVQFLDAIFQKGTRKSRRLHNLTDAVIIFDEVQSVPYHHFALFNSAVNFLHHIGNSSIVLCTATQPTVDKMDYAITLKPDAEMVPNLAQIAQAFERVNVYNHVTTDGLDTQQLADKVQTIMSTKQSVLIILNTKTAVRQLFEELDERNIAPTYHLSTSMCAAHRTEILNEVRQKLGVEPVICVSSQLIEAGVDISFEAVIRSLAGLDAIAQAAGRCNRNAERAKGDVYIVKAKTENLSRLAEIRIGADVMTEHILPYTKDFLHPDTIARYFTAFDAQAKREISQTPRNLDTPLIHLIDGSIKNERKTYMLNSFKTLEQHFEAISSPTTSVLVPYRAEGQQLIAQLNEDMPLDRLNKVVKKAQQYAINIYRYELDALIKEGLLQPLYQDHIFAVHENGYNDKYGLSISGDGSFSNYQF